MAAGQTIIEYNGVTIYGCVTRLFSQESVYDPSGVDFLYERFRVRVSGFIHGDATIRSVGIDPNIDNGSAASQHVWIRDALAQPRAVFLMQMGADQLGQNGTYILQGGADDKGTPAAWLDTDNGPKPRVLGITHVAADHVLRVEWEIELCVRGDKFTSDSEVLSNKWSCADDVDANFFTTRTWNGQIRLVSSVTNPHTFRGWVVPPLQPGMQRSQMTFTPSEDGLWLRYSIVDKEVAFAAPYPATHWDIRHTEEVGEFGITAFSSITVSLSGDRDVDKKVLIRIAAAVIEHKGLGNQFDLDRHKLLSYSVTDHQGSNQSNEVQVSARYQRMIVKNEDNDENVLIQQGQGRVVSSQQQLGSPISAAELQLVVANYDNNLSRGSRADETTELRGPIPIIAALSTYAQNYHLSGFSNIQGPPHTICVGKPAADRYPCVPNFNTDVSVRTGNGKIDEFPDWYDLDAIQDAIYTFYEIITRYVENTLTVQLPVAARIKDTAEQRDVTFDEDIPTFMQFGQVGPPQVTKKVSIKAERQGEWPQVLAPLKEFKDPTIDAYHRLVQFGIWFANPVRRGDGGVATSLRAELEYGVTKRPKKWWNSLPPFWGRASMVPYLLDKVESKIDSDLYFRDPPAAE